MCTLMTFIIGGLMYLTFVNLSFLDPFEKAFKDFKFTDIFYAERFNESKRSEKIILVNVKHENRFKIAQALEKIHSYQPKVIGLDIVFQERKNKFTDSILKEKFLSIPNIVFSFYQDGNEIIENHEFFKSELDKRGYINLDLYGQNTVIRNFKGYNVEKNAYSFSTLLALEAGYIDPQFAQSKLDKPLPINYIGNQEVFLSYTLDEIIESTEIPTVKDAVVILGYLGDLNPEFDIEDKHFTPLNKAWVGRSSPDTFGATIHANILTMLMNKTLLYKVSNLAIFLISFIFCLIVVYLTMRLYHRSNFMFDILQRPIQLILTILLLYLALLLLQSNIYLNITSILLFTILGIEMIDYYIYLMRYLNEKLGWRSTFV